MPWLVHHAVWFIQHFLLKTDGKTSYELLRNGGCNGEVVEFAETAHHKDLTLNDRRHAGIWLGTSDGH